jgi:signal transduction histidine kinase
MTNEEVTGPLSHASSRVIRRFAVPERHLAFWIVMWLLAVAGEAAALAPFVTGPEPVEPVQFVFRLVGGSFAACGLIAWRRRPDSLSGRWMTATGFAFYATPLLAQLDSPIAQTAAHLLPDVWLLFFVPLLLTFLTGGRLRTRMDRVLLGAIIFELAVLAPLYLTVTELPDNVLLISPDPELSNVVDRIQRTWFMFITVGTSVVIAIRWNVASGPRRRAMLPSIAGALCLLLFTALLLVDLLAPTRSQILLWIAVCSMFAVPTAFLAGLLRSRLARGGLADLFGRLPAMPPEQLQAALARVLGDPGLVIAFPRMDGRSYIDADGRSVALPAAGGEKSVARVESDGLAVAALVYDRLLDDDPELVEAVGGAVTIALENRRLHAEALDRLAELQSSRERIIAASDAERRRIERNLHDGAQQRLVTLALQLSMLQRQIRDDPEDAEQLAGAASEELAASLAELRELARGIHPAVLDQGLSYALEALALRSGVPTTLMDELTARLPQPVEFAAYFVASEALTNVAKHAAATRVCIRVAAAPEMAVIEISDDGIGGASTDLGSGLRGLSDRVEALGGRLTISSTPGAGTTVTARMPLQSQASDQG